MFESKYRQTGFSLVELMVVLVLVSGAVYFTMGITDQQAKDQAYTSTISEINTQHSLLQKALRTKEICSDTLAAAETNENSFTGEGVKIQTIGRLQSDGQLTGVSLGKFNKYSLQSIKVADDPLNSTVKTFTVTYVIPGSKFFSQEKVIEKKIDILAEKTSTNVWKCGSIVEATRAETLRLMCERLGANVATWSEATKTCDLKEVKCRPDEVPYKLDRLGRFDCVKAQTLIDLNDLVDQSPEPCPKNSDIALDLTGKLKLKCGGDGDQGSCVEDGMGCPRGDCNKCCDKTYYEQEVPEAPSCGCKIWSQPTKAAHCCSGKLRQKNFDGATSKEVTDCNPTEGLNCWCTTGQPPSCTPATSSWGLTSWGGFSACLNDERTRTGTRVCNRNSCGAECSGPTTLTDTQQPCVGSCSLTKPNCIGGTYEFDYDGCQSTDLCQAACGAWGPNCENNYECRREIGTTGMRCER